jgi:hypothetical protein
MGLGGSNVVLGVLAGYIGLRYWRARHPALKALGASALIGFSGLAIGLNVFAARYRESLAEGSEIGRPMLRLSRGELFGLVTPEAVVLLMIGVGVWMFAATKGYAGLDEPYPDYGKLDRTRVAAEAAYEDLREEAGETLRAPIEAAHAALETDLADRRKALETMRALYDQAGGKLMAIDAARRALAATERALLDLYRRENRAARQSPPPMRFQAPANDMPVREDLLARAGAALAAAQADYAAAQKAAAAARAGLQDLHKQTETRVFGVGADRAA